jgi:predicted O-methyltransferase YrrM
VDVDAFAQRLPELFDGFPEAETPRDRRFARVLEEVPGLARENNLALVNLAASLLPPGESYVEVGSYHGTSLIAASLGNDADVVGIDDFSLRDGSRAQLDANLRRFDVAPTVLEGDAFSLVPGGALDGRKVGVYYYDAAHGYEQQLEGLRMIEPWLADRALLLVDDSDWERVERAIADYVAAQPQARVLLEIGGKERGRPWWWEGVTALAFVRGSA